MSSKYTRKEIRTLVHNWNITNLRYLIVYALKVRFNITSIWYLRYLDE